MGKSTSGCLVYVKNGLRDCLESPKNEVILTKKTVYYMIQEYYRQFGLNIARQMAYFVCSCKVKWSESSFDVFPFGEKEQSNFFT